MDLAAEAAAAEARAAAARAELETQRRKLRHSQAAIITPLRRHIRQENHLAELAIDALRRGSHRGGSDGERATAG